MQGLKEAVAVIVKRSNKVNRCRSSFCNQYNRSLCSTSLHNDLDNQEVLVEGKEGSRTSILNRPLALNALTTNMGHRLLKLYKSWEDNPDIGFVAMKGSGRAFCAGGDIVTLYHLINKGKWEDCKEFFGTLYSFIYLLGTYLKPHVALLNGITMGGGAGVSIPGTFRVATDKTVFATPETLIGFHPDAGASFYLSHLPGHLGEYLALSGETLSGAEMVACGLATHYLHSTVNTEQLGQLVTDDPSVIETSLENYGDLVYPNQMSVLHRIEIVDKCFGCETVEEIFDALESEASKTNDAWCSSTLRRLKEASPLSLKVSLRSIREGRYQTLDQCLVREYRMSLQGISKQITSDFCEGVRARMVDKDLAPKWNPPALEQVSQDMVEHYFSPLSKFLNQEKEPVRVLVTGAAGQIGYAIVPLIARGAMLGPDQPLILHLLDITPQALEGVKMELIDAAFPLLKGVIATTDVIEACMGVNIAVMLAGVPRKEGMERKDMISKNVSIYKAQASALEKHSAPNCKVLVVANPANTNALILKEFASSIPEKNITCLTRLDHNRALSQISERLDVEVSDVKNAIVWGNHSSTQYPDVNHATVKTISGEKPVRELVADDQWLNSEFITTVQQRGAAIIKARMQSSAMSAASAACDHIRDWFLGTPKGTWVSMGVCSDGSYGIPPGLIYSFPVTCEKGKWSIVQGLKIDEFSRKKMDATAQELVEEKSLAYSCLD